MVVGLLPCRLQELKRKRLEGRQPGGTADGTHSHSIWQKTLNYAAELPLPGMSQCKVPAALPALFGMHLVCLDQPAKRCVVGTEAKHSVGSGDITRMVKRPRKSAPAATPATPPPSSSAKLPAISPLVQRYAQASCLHHYCPKPALYISGCYL